MKAITMTDPVTSLIHRTEYFVDILPQKFFEFQKVGATFDYTQLLRHIHDGWIIFQHLK